ncbi:hypothetical protein BU15DRAFT_61635 [Melanogaster broomeanus]|nr:hypothetical protein BU15DRAFT_61635 [Melanogaster broomeanus]
MIIKFRHPNWPSNLLFDSTLRYDMHLAKTVKRKSVLNCLALLLAIFRVWIRVKIKRMWWEIVWAIVAFSCATQAAITSAWINTFTFTCVVWLAQSRFYRAVRISLIFSIIRVIPPRARLHICGLFIVAFFLLICVIIIALKAVYCIREYHELDPTVSDSKFRCYVPRDMGIFELVADCLADAIAVSFPLRMLHSVRLQPRQHRLLRLLFSSSIAVSLVCVARAACELVPDLEIMLPSWTISRYSIPCSFVLATLTHRRLFSQSATCLTVCNLLVVVTYLDRVFGRGNGESTRRTTTTDEGGPVEDDDYTTPPGMSQTSLTTVELVLTRRTGMSGATATSDGTQKPERTISI